MTSARYPLTVLAGQIHAVFQAPDRAAALVAVADQLRAFIRDEPDRLTPVWLLTLAMVIAEDDQDPALIASVVSCVSTAVEVDGCVRR
jgi:hypothetical protein